MHEPPLVDPVLREEVVRALRAHAEAARPHFDSVRAHWELRGLGPRLLQADVPRDLAMLWRARCKATGASEAFERFWGLAEEQRVEVAWGFDFAAFVADSFVQLHEQAGGSHLDLLGYRVLDFAFSFVAWTYLPSEVVEALGGEVAVPRLLGACAQASVVALQGTLPATTDPYADQRAARRSESRRPALDRLEQNRLEAFEQMFCDSMLHEAWARRADARGARLGTGVRATDGSMAFSRDLGDREQSAELALVRARAAARTDLPTHEDDEGRVIYEHLGTVGRDTRRRVEHVQNPGRHQKDRGRRRERALREAGLPAAVPPPRTAYPPENREPDLVGARDPLADVRAQREALEALAAVADAFERARPPLSRAMAAVVAAVRMGQSPGKTHAEAAGVSPAAVSQAWRSFRQEAESLELAILGERPVGESPESP